MIEHAKAQIKINRTVIAGIYWNWSAATLIEIMTWSIYIGERQLHIKDQTQKDKVTVSVAIKFPVLGKATWLSEVYGDTQKACIII